MADRHVLIEHIIKVEGATPAGSAFDATELKKMAKAATELTKTLQTSVKDNKKTTKSLVQSNEKVGKARTAELKKRREHLAELQKQRLMRERQGVKDTFRLQEAAATVRQKRLLEIGTSKQKGKIELQDIRQRHREELRNSRQKEREKLIGIRNQEKEERRVARKQEIRRTVIGGGVLAVAGAAVTGAVNVYAAGQQFAGASPYAGAVGLPQAYLAKQNQKTNAILSSLTAGLGVAGGVAGFLGGGPLGSAAGAVAGGSLGLALKAHFGSRAIAARTGALRLALSAKEAYLSGAFSGGGLQESSLPNSDMIANLPTSIAQMVKGSSIENIPAFTALSRQTKRMGIPINANDPAVRMLAAMSATGMNINPITQGASFIAARSGRSVKNVLEDMTDFSQKTGISQVEQSSVIPALMQNTSLNTPEKAQAFLKASTPLGPAYQQSALSYQRAAPLEQFTARMRMKALFPGIDPRKVFGGNREEIQRLNQEAQGMNTRGFPMGDVLEEQAVGSANFRAIRNVSEEKSEGEMDVNKKMERDFEKAIGSFFTKLTSEMTKHLSVDKMTVKKLVMEEQLLRDTRWP